MSDKIQFDPAQRVAAAESSDPEYLAAWFAHGYAPRLKDRDWRDLAADLLVILRSAVAPAVAAEREACAAICDDVQKRANNRHAASYDPSEGSDGATEAAELIRARAEVAR